MGGNLIASFTAGGFQQTLHMPATDFRPPPVFNDIVQILGAEHAKLRVAERATDHPAVQSLAHGAAHCRAGYILLKHCLSLRAPVLNGFNGVSFGKTAHGL